MRESRLVKRASSGLGIVVLEGPPLRKISHEHRVELGRQISNRILETFGENVLAVFITGSTAKSLDRPYPDLEMIAVVQDVLDVPTKYYVIDGLLVQLDYKKESIYLKDTNPATISMSPRKSLGCSEHSNSCFQNQLEVRTYFLLTR